MCQCLRICPCRRRSLDNRRTSWNTRAILFEPALAATGDSFQKEIDRYGAALETPRRYLLEVNVDIRLADEMLRIDPDRVRYLSRAEQVLRSALGKKGRHSAIALCSSAPAGTLADRRPKLWVRRTAGDWLHCRLLKLRPRPHPLQSRSDSEVISPTAMAGGNAGLVLCQVGAQYSGQ
jgi:hypothetical protein